VREANFMAQPLMQAPDPWHGLMRSSMAEICISNAMIAGLKSKGR
jgi:hypothetical protein